MLVQRNVCEIHTAYLFDKGGTRRLLGLAPLVSVSWQRLRDDISAAQVQLAAPECLADVSTIEPGRHELVVYRGKSRVWEGPVTLVRWDRGVVTIEAKDVMFYAARCVMRSAYSSAYPNVETVVNRARRIIVAELARMEALDPPINVLPHLATYHHPDDARTTRVTSAYQKTVYDDVDDMAAKSGLDYTVIGRSIIVHDTHLPLARTTTLTEADFDGNVVVTAYGNELATYAAVTGGSGMWGSAGGIDPYYGLWEIVDDAYDEEEGGAEPTQEELESQALRNLAGRNPTPVTVRVPEGSSLAATAAVQVEDLVPGVQVPLLATLTGRRLSQMQKLDRVDVSETSDGETVRVTLSPESANALDLGELQVVVRRGAGQGVVV